MALLKAIPVAVVCVFFLCGALALTCYECYSNDDASCVQTTVQSTWRNTSCDTDRELIGVPQSEWRCIRADYTEGDSLVQYIKVATLVNHQIYSNDFQITSKKCRECAAAKASVNSWQIRICLTWAASGVIFAHLISAMCRMNYTNNYALSLYNVGNQSLPFAYM